MLLVVLHEVGLGVLQLVLLAGLQKAGHIGHMWAYVRESQRTQSPRKRKERRKGKEKKGEGKREGRKEGKKKKRKKEKGKEKKRGKEGKSISFT